MRDVDRIIRERAAVSPGFDGMVEQDLAELRMGLVIRGLRQENGITQEELARWCRDWRTALAARG